MNNPKGSGVQDLLNWVAAPEKSASQGFYIYGDSGIGKSMLLKKMMSMLSSDNVRWASFDFRSDRGMTHNLTQFLLEIERQLDISTPTLHQSQLSLSQEVDLLKLFQNDVQKATSKQSIFLFFDSFEFAPTDFTEWFTTNFLPSMTSVSIIFAGRQELKHLPSNVKTIQLQGFTHDEIKEYFQRVMDQVPDEIIIDELLRFTKGNPRLLAEISHAIIASSHNGILDKENVNSALTRLKVNEAPPYKRELRDTESTIQFTPQGTYWTKFTGKETRMTNSTSFDFYLYRMKLTFAEQKNLFGQEDLSRSEIIKRIITDKPSSELRKGNFWHVGNVKFVGDYGGYFAVGKTTKSILEKYDDETGDFVEEVDETSPYTHVVFDAEIGLFSVAKKLRLSPTINGIANKVKALFQDSEMAFRYGLTISLDPISDPKDFIEALESAYSIRSFTVTFTRSNPFDVDEYFQRPMEKYLDAANGKDGTTTVKGEDLNSETLVTVTKSVAATGNDAKAYLKPSQKERVIRKSLKSNPAYFSLPADEFTEELALSRARKLYKTVRGSEHS